MDGHISGSLLDLYASSPSQNGRSKRSGSAGIPLAASQQQLSVASGGISQEIEPQVPAAPAIPAGIPQAGKPLVPAIPEAPAASSLVPEPLAPAAPAISAAPVEPPQVAEQQVPAVPEQPDRDPDERTLTEAAGPMYLMASSQPVLPLSCEPAGYLSYRQRFLEGCGTPQDPIEVLLLESLTLAFHNAGRMFVLSAGAGTSDTNVAYADAAARLTAEFRRGALALQDYRAKARDAGPAKPREGRRKSRKAADLRPRPPARRKKGCNGKLGSNSNGARHLWLQKRFEFPTPDESLPAEAIACGGRG